MEIIQGQNKLKMGYTTGSCSAAATKAAVYMMLTGKRYEYVKLNTPKGIELKLNVHNQEFQENSAMCSIKKDAGDDPDVTHGLHIFAKVNMIYENDFFAPPLSCNPYIEKIEVRGKLIEIMIYGGKGVGKVTKIGLSCEQGKSAINPVPRKMIASSIKEALEENLKIETVRYDSTAGFNSKELPKQIWVEIEVENGEETALKTFNPKLGIIGGISILGTSGIVEPMSEKALIDTIKTEIKQFSKLNIEEGKDLNKIPPMLVCPGNYGRDYAKEELGLDLENGVKCSNYIGEMLDYSCYLNIPKILLIGHAGKLIKLAAGVMNTHSSSADSRQEVMVAHGALNGASRGTLEKVMAAISIEEMIDIINEESENLGLKTFDSIEKKIREHVDHRTRKKIQVEYIIFTKTHKAVIYSSGALKFLKEIKEVEEIKES